MDKIISLEQVQGFVADIRNLRQGFVTNFFWDDQPQCLNNSIIQTLMVFVTSLKIKEGVQ